MSRARDTKPRQSAIGPFLGIFCVVLLLAILLEYVAPGVFTKFLGPLSSLLSVLLAGGIGIAVLAAISTGDAAAPWKAMATVGVLFVVPPVMLDVICGFPKDMNIALPEALAYYPVAGFIAESVFHLVPLGIMAALLRTRDLPVWAYAPAAISESAFQMFWSGGLSPLGVLVAFHVLAFSTVQLVVFRRHGYTAMFCLRLMFYAAWHVAWGALRLPLLFPA